MFMCRPGEHVSYGPTVLPLLAPSKKVVAKFFACEEVKLEKLLEAKAEETVKGIQRAVRAKEKCPAPEPKKRPLKMTVETKCKVEKKHRAEKLDGKGVENMRCVKREVKVEEKVKEDTGEEKSKDKVEAVKLEEKAEENVKDVKLEEKAEEKFAAVKLEGKGKERVEAVKLEEKAEEAKDKNAELKKAWLPESASRKSALLLFLDSEMEDDPVAGNELVKILNLSDQVKRRRLAEAAMACQYDDRAPSCFDIDNGPRQPAIAPSAARLLQEYCLLLRKRRMRKQQLDKERAEIHMAYALAELGA